MPVNDANQDKLKSKPPQTASIEDGIGIRLKAAREAKGMAQSDLHSKTGLSRTVLINYEAGRHKPGARELRLLCDALEVSPNHLIYGTEEPHSKSAGLADTVLNMGDAALIPAAFLGPMLGAMLGKDDTRTILTLVESLLKAKDPVGYATIMEMVEVIKGELNKPQEEKGKTTLELLTTPDAADKFKQQLTEKIQARINSNNKR